MPSESFNPQPVYVCVRVCMKANMLDMSVYISMYLLCVCLMCVCVCVCGVWVAKWESCVESVHRFITELWQCEDKHSTFICLAAHSSFVSAFYFMYTVNI